MVSQNMGQNHGRIALLVLGTGGWGHHAGVMPGQALVGIGEPVPPRGEFGVAAGRVGPDPVAALVGDLLGLGEDDDYLAHASRAALSSSPGGGPGACRARLSRCLQRGSRRALWRGHACCVNTLEISMLSRFLLRAFAARSSWRVRALLVAATLCTSASYDTQDKQISRVGCLASVLLR